MNKTLKLHLLFGLLALTFAALLFDMLAAKKQKFDAQITDSYYRHNNTHSFFADINNDHTFETITVSEWGNNKAVLFEIINQNNRVIHSTLIPFHKLPLMSRPPTAFRYDKSEHQKMAFLTEKNDSIFLNVGTNNTKLKQIFVDDIPASEKPNGYTYDFFHFQDINNDNKNEIYLYISQGFRIRPRKLYCIDVANETLLFETPEIGAFPNGVITIQTSGKPQFIVTTQATGLFDTDSLTRISDQFSYMLFYDYRLTESSPPIKLANEFSYANIFKPTDIDSLNALVFVSSDSIKGRPQVLLVNKKNKIVGQTNLHNQINPTHEGIFYKDKAIWFTNEKNKLIRFDITKQTEKMVEIKGINSPLYIKQADLHNDGKFEYLFRDLASNNYAILDHHIKHAAIFSVPISQLPLNYCVRLSKQFNAAFTAEGKNAQVFIQYNSNPNYFISNILQFILYFFIIWGLFEFIHLINSILLKKQNQMKNQILELQFQNMRNQMSPHFTLNALNVVGNSILKDNKHEAYENFTVFTKLIRQMLTDANLKLRSLQQELDFTHHFINLQQKRFTNKFSYLFNIAPNVDTDILVPPLIIETYVENAIKHGLNSIENGTLTISVTDQKKFICIEIADNGIGRKASEKLPKQSTGIGNRLMNNYYKLLNTNNKNQITITITDLNPTNKNTGTLVKIIVPKKLKTL